LNERLRATEPWSAESGPTESGAPSHGSSASTAAPPIISTPVVPMRSRPAGTRSKILPFSTETLAHEVFPAPIIFRRLFPKLLCFSYGCRDRTFFGLAEHFRLRNVMLRLLGQVPVFPGFLRVRGGGGLGKENIRVLRCHLDRVGRRIVLLGVAFGGIHVTRLIPGRGRLILVRIG
jgi:hypothetical protein